MHQGILDRPQLEPEQREQALLELAVDYLRAGLLDRSESLYLKLAESRQHRLTALRALIGIYEQQHDWRQAINSHRQLASAGGAVHSGTIAHYHCELAEAARTSGQFEEGAPLAARGASRATALSARRDPARGDCMMRVMTPWQCGSCCSPSSANLHCCWKYCHASHACGRRVANPRATFDAGIAALQRNRRLRGTSFGQRSDPADVIEEPNALGAIRDYVLSDGLLRELAQPLDSTRGLDDDTLRRVAKLLGRVLSRHPRYRCGECGFASHAWFWQCPGCKNWDSLQA